MGSFFPDDSILCQGDREANRTKVGSETAVWVEYTNTDTDKIASPIRGRTKSQTRQIK